MKKIVKDFRNLLIICLLELVTGIVVLIDPFGFTRTLLMIVGIVLAIFGVTFGVQYFKKTPEAASLSNDLFFGILLVMAGLFMLVKPDNIITVFSLLTTLYGVGIIVSAIAKLQQSVDQLRLKNKKWWYFAILTAVTLIIGIVSYTNPFQTITVNWQFTGICLIILAIADIATIILNSMDIKIKPKQTPKPEEIKKEDAIDAEVKVTEVFNPAEPLIESVVNEAADAEEAFAEKVDITASEMAEDIVEAVKDETGVQEDQE